VCWTDSAQTSPLVVASQDETIRISTTRVRVAHSPQKRLLVRSAFAEVTPPGTALPMDQRWIRRLGGQEPRGM